MMEGQRWLLPWKLVLATERDCGLGLTQRIGGQPGPVDAILSRAAAFVGKMVPREGLEPTHLREVADFKSAASAVSPPRHVSKPKRRNASLIQSAAPGFSGLAGRRSSDDRWLIDAENMEATGGFEPPNRGFADLRLNHLATSPRFCAALSCSSSLCLDATVMVPRAGLEPTRAKAHGPLKTACLPFPPPRLAHIAV